MLTSQRIISQQVPKLLLCIMSLEIKFLELLPYFSGGQWVKVILHKRVTICPMNFMIPSNYFFGLATILWCLKRWVRKCIGLANPLPQIWHRELRILRCTSRICLFKRPPIINVLPQVPHRCGPLPWNKMIKINDSSQQMLKSSTCWISVQSVSYFVCFC